MNKFYQLLKPSAHSDLYNRTVYRVEVATIDPDGDTLYLHSDGKVKDGLINLGNPCTTCDFTSLDKAYLAINDYYVAHCQTTPFGRVGGVWRACGVFNYGQTTESMLDSFNESEPMEFE